MNKVILYPHFATFESIKNCNSTFQSNDFFWPCLRIAQCFLAYFIRSWQYLFYFLRLDGNLLLGHFRECFYKRQHSNTLYACFGLGLRSQVFCTRDDAWKIITQLITFLQCFHPQILHFWNLSCCSKHLCTKSFWPTNTE